MQINTKEIDSSNGSIKYQIKSLESIANDKQ